MRTINKHIHIFILSLALLLSGCQSLRLSKPIINPQYLTTMTEYESFDIMPYKDKIDPLRNLMHYNYVQEDGTEIHIYWEEGFGAQIDETPPKPYVYRVLKLFNADGSLKEKGAYIGSNFGGKIGRWLECDEEGNCKVVDYEVNRGRFGYKEALKFLEKKGQVNLRTGQGREWVHMSYSYENNCWKVSTQNPGEYWVTEYILDGNTGKILNEKIIPIEVG